ncbi:hypothetical protein SAMN05880590_102753 [Rhizobium sp. RU35A]|uniref:Clp protease n=1 Tax=Rhizobium sp. RU35A TaxID=1907414 RepID=UPI0009555339|nr:Clp protease [Rhizobium sp. RU35A]SIQ24173.1 hypothetical protein SAMN05880590_102753 [Rhizobium sp. RU35A]
MILDLAAISGLVALALSSLNLIAHIRTLMSQGEKKLDERLVKVEGKLIDHDRRIQAVESDMKHLPDKETQHRQELQLVEMNGKLAALEERLKPIAAVAIRLQEYMLEQGNK